MTMPASNANNANSANKLIHSTLEEQLRERISAGEWAPDAAIPSENELARQYNVSRMTARSVITQLVGAGLLYRIPGKGTFVRNRPTIDRSGKYTSIREQLQMQGREVTTKFLSLDEIAAPEGIAKILSLRPDDRMIYVLRLIRYLDGEPFCLHTCHFRASRFPGLAGHDFESTKCRDLLREKYGVDRDSVDETLESTVASFEEASKLGVLPGHPLMLLCSLIYDKDGLPYEYTKILFRGDRIRLSFHY